jgi:acyl-CoA reductase-like NAD-dependent aldehyde dehydrogenase
LIWLADYFSKINCASNVGPGVPFGGYKQSGTGKELGEYALATYVFLFVVQDLMAESFG